MASLVENLEKLLAAGEEFEYSIFPMSRHGYPTDYLPAWTTWVKRIEITLLRAFQEESAPVALLRQGLQAHEYIVGNEMQHFIGAKSALCEALKVAIGTIRSDNFGELQGTRGPARNGIQSSKVFVVHGHDHEAKNELELFLRSLGLEPVVLHREADRGLTLIEKFEKHSDVGYAVVLLTKDDEVIGLGEEPEQRARQNVVFEWGFFTGLLGRERVCCLYQEGVSLPSDVSGLLYKPFRDHIEEVKFALVKELRATGYHVTL